MRIKTVFVGIAVLLICSGCGLFSLRDDFEDPLRQTSPRDLFHFGELLNKSTEEFSKLAYDDLLNDAFEFHDVNSNKAIFTKQDFIGHLQQLENSNQEVWVEWKNQTALVRGDTIFINDAQYDIYLQGSADTADFQGKSTLQIVRNAGVWQFYRWTDVPDTKEKSFFAPAD